MTIKQIYYGGSIGIARESNCGLFRREILSIVCGVDVMLGFGHLTPDESERIQGHQWQLRISGKGLTSAISLGEQSVFSTFPTMSAREQGNVTSGRGGYF